MAALMAATKLTRLVLHANFAAFKRHINNASLI